MPYGLRIILSVRGKSSHICTGITTMRKGWVMGTTDL